jgi:acetyl esterase/lipase
MYIHQIIKLFSIRLRRALRGGDMAIDPQAQAILDYIVASGRPPLETLDPTAARAVARTMFVYFAAPPEPVAAATNDSLPGPGGMIPIRIYRPAGAAGDAVLPALVFFHGGGFVIGDLDTHDPTCRALANRGGCAVVSVDYRLAPEHPFPAGVEDCWAAVEGVRLQAARLGIDGARLAVGGDSAGGNLAAVTALMARDAGVELALQLLIYPVTDLRGSSASYHQFADGYLLTRAAMVWFGRHYMKRPGDAADWRASPILAADLAGLAPALVVTAGFDPLRDEGRDYADRLAAAGIETDYRCFDGMIHGFLGMNRAVETAETALAACGAALRRAFAA